MSGQNDEEEKETSKMRTTLGEVLEKKGMTKYQFAIKELKKKPNTLTPWDKPKFDPKLSTVIKMAKKLGCNVNDLFKAEGYHPDGTKPDKARAVKTPKSRVTKAPKNVAKRNTGTRTRRKLAS